MADTIYDFAPTTDDWLSYDFAPTTDDWLSYGTDLYGIGNSDPFDFWDSADLGLGDLGISDPNFFDIALDDALWADFDEAMLSGASETDLTKLASLAFGGLSGGSSSGLWDKLKAALGGQENTSGTSLTGNSSLDALLSAALLGGSFFDKGGSEESAVSRTYQYPEWVTSAAQDLLSQADALPTERSYTGELTAPLSGNQQAGIEAAGGLALPEEYAKALAAIGGISPEYAGNLQQALSGYRQDALDTLSPYGGAYGGDLTTALSGYIDKAGTQADLSGTQIADMIDFAGGPKSIADIDMSTYMNPYLDEVLDPILRRINESQAAELANINASSGMHDAFGTGRSLLMQDLTKQRYQQAADEAEAKLRSEAWDKALTSAGGDISNVMDIYRGIPGLLGGLSGTYSGLGTIEQALESGNLEKLYSDFVRQQEALPAKADFISGIGAADERLGEANIGRLYDAFTNANQTYGTLADLYSGLGTTQFNTQQDIIDTLMSTGSTARDVTDTGLLRDYAAWTEEQQYPFDRLTALGTAFNTAQPSNISYQEQSEDTYNPSTFQNVLSTTGVLANTGGLESIFDLGSDLYNVFAGDNT